MTEKGERAVPRQIPRAQVLAFLVLNGGEDVQPERIEFREYRYVEGDGKEYHAVNITLDDEVALWHWARVFGLAESRIRSQPWTDSEGDVWTCYAAFGQWRGFHLNLEAKVPSTPTVAAGLDDATRAQLEQLVELADRALAEPVREAAGRWAGEVPGEVYERDDEPVPVVDPSTVVGWPVGGGR